MSGHTTAAPLAYSSPPYPSPGCVDGQHQVVGAQAVALCVRYPPAPSPGCVDGQHQVVGAQAVALRVRVAEDARLKHLVVGVVNA